jgi:hypothetical protein
MHDVGSRRQRSRYTAITAATKPIADLSVNPPANTAKYAAGMATCTTVTITSALPVCTLDALARRLLSASRPSASNTQAGTAICHLTTENCGIPLTSKNGLTTASKNKLKAADASALFKPLLFMKSGQRPKQIPETIAFR